MPNEADSSVWVTESSQGRQTAFGIIGALVGGAFLYGSRMSGLEQPTRSAVLLLGLLMMVISLVALVRGGKEVISVDPRRRLIEIQTHTRFGSQKRMIPFSHVSAVYVGELGDEEGGSISYHVVMKLKSGKEVALFLGAYDGAYDKLAAESRCRRLEDYLGAAPSPM